jgi:hypothetical protein
VQAPVDEREAALEEPAHPEVGVAVDVEERRTVLEEEAARGRDGVELERLYRTASGRPARRASARSASSRW